MTADDPTQTNQGLMNHMTSYVMKNFASMGSLAPMWTIIADNGTAIPIVTPFDGPTEKDVTALIVKQLMHEHNAVRIGFMAESWMADSKGGPTVNENTIPSEHPNRKEVIIFMVEDRDGQNMMSHIEIKRDANGNPILQSVEQHPGISTGGRFSNMFPPRIVN